MNPIYAINDYVWNVLRQELGWTKINNKVPVLPSREQPEFEGQTKPYLIYKGSRETGRGELSPVRLGVVQYMIYASDIAATQSTPSKSSTSQISAAIDLIDNALNRLDESGMDINRNAYNPQNPRHAAFNGTHVTWTRIIDTDTPDPSENEGGKAVGYISIRYQYSVAEKAYTVLY